MCVYWRDIAGIGSKKEKMTQVFTILKLVILKLEFDYVGVIIGEDMRYENGRITAIALIGESSMKPVTGILCSFDRKIQK